MEKPTEVKLSIEDNILQLLRNQFAYEKRDDIQLYGAVKVNAMFDGWLVEYLTKKVEADQKQFKSRMTAKQDAKVLELVRKYNFSLEDAEKRVYGTKPLPAQTASK